jgi:hypothetical protein
MARLVADASDSELEHRFGSPLALRALLTAMAKGFQPSMAFGFEGEIAFEISSATHAVDGPEAGVQWWTIHVMGARAVARHRTARDPAVTLHVTVPTLVRLVAGIVNPVTEWIEKRAQVSGDVTLANRMVEMFGGVAPLELTAEVLPAHGGSRAT